MEKDAMVDVLNDLIQIAEDSHEGYRKIAEDIEDPELQTLFNDVAAARGGIVRDLQIHVAEQGGVPAASGTFFGGAHRVFVDIKAALFGNDREVFLGEIERGESEAQRRFEAALDHDLPPHLATAVGRHLGQIKADRERIIALRKMKPDSDPIA